MRRLAWAARQGSRLRRIVGSAMGAPMADLCDPAVWQRAMVLACLRERSPDLLANGPENAAALADLILRDTRTRADAVPDRYGRTL